MDNGFFKNPPGAEAVLRVNKAVRTDKCMKAGEGGKAAGGEIQLSGRINVQKTK